jgi:hypothetical protein
LMLTLWALILMACLNESLIRAFVQSNWRTSRIFNTLL